jgi:hypothetical protein
MKVLVILFLLCVGISAQAAHPLADPATPLLDGYAITFSDEFEGQSLNPNKWNVGINRGNAVQTNQHSTYSKNNISFSDGKLLFHARKEAKPVIGRVYGGGKQTFQYTTAGINTNTLYQLKGEFYIEIRCTLPKNPGGYCAFWTMPEQKKAVAVIDHHETDFFEFKCNPAKATHFRYFSSLWRHKITKDEAKDHPKEISSEKNVGLWVNEQKHKPHFQPFNGRIKKGIDFSKPFTMGFKATKDLLSWHIAQNGTAYNTPPYLEFKKQPVHSKPISSENKQPFLTVTRAVPKFDNYIILNYRLSEASWAGGPVDQGALPANMSVDYIRVYQKQSPIPKP